MNTKPFRFKQFSLSHSRSSMKVGTDAVLMGAWCPVDGEQRVLDVGTGCGIIALMLAQRCRQAHIAGIDIHQSSVEEASENFKASPWSDRLTAQLADVRAITATESYDLVVSNPPFYQEDIFSPSDLRNQSRHTHDLSFGQLLTSASRILSDNGTVSIITPASARDAVINAAAHAGLHVQREITVIPVRGQNPKRILWSFKPTMCDIERDSLVIQESDHEFSSEYIQLTKDFHPQF
ncbi:MAG: methyltransferase [Muribaculaceae bacterium]|nr:methyltransferase [Muribaculaceae bacterium]